MKTDKYIPGVCLLLAVFVPAVSQGQAIVCRPFMGMAGAFGTVLTGEAGVPPANETPASSLAVVFFEQSVVLQQADQWGRPSAGKLPVRVAVGSDSELRPGMQDVLRIVVETPGFEKYVRDTSTFIKNVEVLIRYTDASVSVTSLPKQWGYTVVKRENYGRHSLVPVLSRETKNEGEADTAAESEQDAGLAGSVLSTVAEQWLFAAISALEPSADAAYEIPGSPVDPEEALRQQDKYDFLTLRPYGVYRAAGEPYDTYFTRRTYDVPISIAKNGSWELAVMVRNLAVAPIGKPEHLYTLSPTDGQRVVVIELKPAQDRAKQEDIENAIVNSVGMKLIYIKPGEFRMGGAAGERWHDDSEAPRHLVKLTKGFYVGATEVTQAQWVETMNTHPWSGRRYVMEGDDYPASYVNWNDAIEFCAKLSEKEGRRYRLPTEAEWEYACRAGSTTAFSFGDDYRKLGDFAWFVDNAIFARGTGDRYAREVAQKKPNPWGLYDMHGNVGEWCSDWYGTYPANPVTDPKGSASGEYRILRGGSWFTSPEHCRSVGRKWNEPDGLYGDSGFRVVLDLE